MTSTRARGWVCRRTDGTSWRSPSTAGSPTSLGATTQELGQWLRHFGAYRGINMDGGGSTTLAWWDPSSEDADKCKLLNRPVGNGVKAEQLPAELFAPTERANGNNLGVAIDSPRTTHDANLYLFVDDYWIESQQGLTRIHNRPGRSINRSSGPTIRRLRPIAPGAT